MTGRKTIGLVMAITGSCMAYAGLTLGNSTASASKDSAKVSICHATSSESVPYVSIVVAQSSVDGLGNNDHSSHTGPVWYPGATADGIVWGDIIPPIPGVTPGMNWDAVGQSFASNRCRYVAPGATSTSAGEATTTTAVLTLCDIEGEGECLMPCESETDSSSSENSIAGMIAGGASISSSGMDPSCIPDTTLPPDSTLPPEPTLPPTVPPTLPPEPTLPPTVPPTVPPDTLVVPVTTAPVTTGAPQPSTTAVASGGPTSSAGATTTTAVASGGPTTALAGNGGEISGGLPTTGSNQRVLIVVGLLMVLGGVVSLLLSRRTNGL